MLMFKVLIVVIAYSNSEIVYIIYILYACLFILGRQFESFCTTSVTENNTNQNDKDGEKTIALTPRENKYEATTISIFGVHICFFFRCCLDGPVAEKFHGSLELSYISNKNRTEKKQQIFVSCQWNDPSF